MEKIKILLVDDHNMIRYGLKSFLNNNELEVIGEAKNGLEALEFLALNTVQVLVTDISMPKMDGIALAKEVSDKYPQIGILALSMLNEAYHIKQMLAAGAKGYLLKDCTEDELKKAILTIAEGKNYYSPEVTQIVMDGLGNKPQPKNRVTVDAPLTDRETEVLKLICKEYTNSEIADKLFISVRTVEAHKRNLLEKTGCKNVAGLAIYAVERQLFIDL